MFVSKSVTDPDVVYLTEVWSSREAWERAVASDAIIARASNMAPHVERRPETIELETIGGKGLPSRSRT
jgi:quinol monooxygenase YgiN